MNRQQSSFLLSTSPTGWLPACLSQYMLVPTEIADTQVVEQCRQLFLMWWHCVALLSETWAALCGFCKEMNPL